MLELLRWKNNNFCNFYQASSSEMFGLNNEVNVHNEDSEFKPNSSYASGKLTNHKKVRYLRDKYDWNIFFVRLIFEMKVHFISPSK